MKLRSIFGLGFAVLVVACGGSGAGSADESSGAVVASDTIALASGHYSGIDLVVKNGKVSGHFFSSVGDPAHGGATCEFTFAGTVSESDGVERASITAVDGYDTTKGELRAVAGGKIALRTDSLLNACMRSAPVLSDEGGDVEELSSKMESDVLGYRSVGAERAYFYDAPGGAARSAYVLQGDTVVTLAAEASGFVKARFAAKTTTTGFLKLADLAGSDAATTR